MNENILEIYKRGDAPLPAKMWLWPLYGAGFENLGRDGKPILVPVPGYGPDELLVRHDCVGHCFSDVKVIRAGDHHPRLQGRDMKANPVVLGHEVALTIVGVGENLRDRFHVGERYIIQADIYVGGKTFAYGYVLQGGLSQYNVVGEEVLNGDDGCYLLPIENNLSYAAVALTEPWSCVEQAYHIDYRTSWRDGGVLWVIGTADGASREYTLGHPWSAGEKQRLVIVSDIPPALKAGLQAQADSWGIPLVEMDDLDSRSFERAMARTGGEGLDDIVLLGADADIAEQALRYLRRGGMLNIVAEGPMGRAVEVDVGRIHYDHLAIVGTMEPDISKAYTPIRTQLKPGGKAWFLGAAGPMGRILVQYALESQDRPQVIVPHDLVGWRLAEMTSSLRALAEARGVEMIPLNQEGMEIDEVHARLRDIASEGFDDIFVPAPSPRAVETAVLHVATDGVVNIFAGLPRGTVAMLDLTPVYQRGVRFVGSSGSSIAHMQRTLTRAERGELFPNQVVAAIGSLSAAYEGLQAVSNGRFAGRVVVYPHIKDLPVTPLKDLAEALPRVYALLGEGGTWTKAAEDELLREMLLHD